MGIEPSTDEVVEMTALSYKHFGFGGVSDFLVPPFELSVCYFAFILRLVPAEFCTTSRVSCMDVACNNCETRCFVYIRMGGQAKIDDYGNR